MAVCGAWVGIPSGICEVNGSAQSWLVPDDARGVPFPRQVFCQIHMTRTEAMHSAVGEADLHFALQGDDELPPWGIVPIAKMAGLCTSEHDTLRSQERGQFGVGGEV
jgi:hypothetical protein